MLLALFQICQNASLTLLDPELQISFEDRDITIAISELHKLGFITTPVTVIGEKPIVGFDITKAG